MSSSGGSPVGGRPNDPFERYYQIKNLEEIREDNQRNEYRSSNQNSLFATYLLFLLQKILKFITGPKHQDLSKPAKKETKENLLEMQKALKILMKEDRSQEALFLKQLSQFWQKMLEDSLRFKKMTPLAIHFKTFIKEIASYPEARDHSLGYYLSEYAGQSWLPFPYMELIQKLHTLAEKNPSHNPLAKWILSLDKIIALLNQE
jgi:hypothetical protein